ncbi:branched-chain amino acid ABC transporter permease [Desulfovibrio sp. OttesenSCG-928-F07]|nr:branched-chain amino acid ABC transporter permease [Desulfovibrio sp. OttesenSCG-928-F07]
MRGIFRSAKVSLWFMALTFPLICIRVDTISDPVIITWRLMNAVYLGLAIFVLSFVWRGMLVRKGDMTPEEADLVWLFELLQNNTIRNSAQGLLYLGLWSVPLAVAWYEKKSIANVGALPFILLAVGVIYALIAFTGRQNTARAAASSVRTAINSHKQGKLALIALALAFCLALPLVVDSYQAKVLTQALIWVALGLGLNIIVGQTGLLVLGYMAFYAVGAYTYGIINNNLPMIGFWPLLPLGGLFAIIAGLAIGIPVLRLRGDYLAIVTLGFGEIMNQVLLNMVSITGGANGIAGIPKPSLFGIAISPAQGAMYVYYIALALAIVTIIAVARLRDSRLGRSWMAMREDEIACEMMGIDKTRAKLAAFALGACWAGFGGVLFAAKESLVNPVAFGFMESITILCVVVLGGLGSIWGVALGAVIIVALPEYLRAFSEYRMLLFGACLVLMMVFRPQGLVAPRRKEWVITDPELNAQNNMAFAATNAKPMAEPASASAEGGAK